MTRPALQDSRSLSLAGALTALREDIQAEHALITRRSLIARIRAEVTLEPQERLALEAYEHTMVANRTNAAGKVVGRRIHALVRITPLVLPVGFSARWLYAYHFAPGVAR
jgi:hypothetical protein